mmetsp:Transcript_5707/g.14762  ORF Transcript_5707/g.14762 Transcript_5707/m.14762 type:complete len:696 (+) Transcript_5707:530-2617(+)
MELRGGSRAAEAEVQSAESGRGRDQHCRGDKRLQPSQVQEPVRGPGREGPVAADQGGSAAAVSRLGVSVGHLALQGGQAGTAWEAEPQSERSKEVAPTSDARRRGLCGDDDDDDDARRDDGGHERGERRGGDFAALDERRGPDDDDQLPRVSRGQRRRHRERRQRRPRADQRGPRPGQISVAVGLDVLLPLHRPEPLPAVPDLPGSPGGGGGVPVPARGRPGKEERGEEAAQVHSDDQGVELPRGAGQGGRLLRAQAGPKHFPEGRGQQGGCEFEEAPPHSAVQGVELQVEHLADEEGQVRQEGVGQVRDVLPRGQEGDPAGHDAATATAAPPPTTAAIAGALSAGWDARVAGAESAAGGGARAGGGRPWEGQDRGAALRGQRLPLEGGQGAAAAGPLALGRARRRSDHPIDDGDSLFERGLGQGIQQLAGAAGLDQGEPPPLRGDGGVQHPDLRLGANQRDLAHLQRPDADAEQDEAGGHQGGAHAGPLADDAAAEGQRGLVRAAGGGLGGDDPGRVGEPDAPDSRRGAQALPQPPREAAHRSHHGRTEPLHGLPECVGHVQVHRLQRVPREPHLHLRSLRRVRGPVTHVAEPPGRGDSDPNDLQLLGFAPRAEHLAAIAARELLVLAAHAAHAAHARREPDARPRQRAEPAGRGRRQRERERRDAQPGQWRHGGNCDCDRPGRRRGLAGGRPG